MREIKFRAWDTRYERMVFSDQLNIIGFENIPHYLKLMQYIGIKDTSPEPNEIYEGDIVECWDDSFMDDDRAYIKGVIEYNTVSFSLKSDDKVLPYWYNADNIKVIGNIHQNPEMINADS